MDTMSDTGNTNAFDNFPLIGGLMVSKMVIDEHIKPRFMYREKRASKEDSGWRIFTGLESDEYINNPNNAGIYNPSTILRIDPSIADLLLKGVGSVYERTEEGTEWYKVTDFDLEDDHMVTHKLTGEWTIGINNLFERIVEEAGDLMYTTGDKTARLAIWKEEKTKAEIKAEYEHYIANRDQLEAPTLQTFDLSDEEVARVGYLIKEDDGVKSYGVIYGFSFIDNEIVQAAFYFDEEEDMEWATETWKNIKYKHA